MQGIIREACVEGYDQAVKAEQLGADRIELCSRLDLDGLTPDFETIERVFSELSIPMRVMIRPRAGNFKYSGLEMEHMLATVSFCRQLGVEGVVFGVLNEENEVDIGRTNQLIAESGTLKTVFHRAIESTSNIAKSIDLLKNETAIDAILVSGTGGGKASDHVVELQDFIRRFGDRELVICGKVTDRNIDQLHRLLRASAYHGKLIVGSLIE